ncbi:UNVERIFIED_CONTAM: Hevamine-A [Sesamum radiatum]|uniref:Hevamine-A n=1 Tax=Sesamum radiatum TaxID=300843 RepID=A0AAW2TI55_SESRA
MSTYWGQRSNEGSLQEFCDTGAVKHLCHSKHRNPACQRRGVKLHLSLGGNGTQTLCSPDDASQVAEYLWKTYLAPGTTGPLGDAPLDGIDFSNVSPSPYWDDLVRALAEFNSPQKKVYLSAWATCSYPDPVLGKAIDTGLFDYIWLNYYQNPECGCDTGISCVLASWFKWSCSLPAGKLLFFNLGTCFLSQVFTAISYSPNYGGFLALVHHFNDIKNIYQVRCSQQSLYSEGSLASVRGLNNMVA